MIVKLILIARKNFYASPEIAGFRQTILCFGRQIPIFLISAPFESVKNGFLPSNQVLCVW